MPYFGLGSGCQISRHNTDITRTFKQPDTTYKKTGTPYIYRTTRYILKDRHNTYIRYTEDIETPNTFTQKHPNTHTDTRTHTDISH